MKRVEFKVCVNGKSFRIISITNDKRYGDQYDLVYQAQVKKEKRYEDVGVYSETDDHAYYWLAHEIKKYAE
jgi:hypothetical protein